MVAYLSSHISSSSSFLQTKFPIHQTHKTPSSILQTKSLPPSTLHLNSRKKKSVKLQPKKFHEEHAFPQSLPLHTKNPSHIYKQIQTFARQNKLEEAFTILDYLDKQGIPVNATTFSSLIAAAIRTKSLSHARLIHTHIRINSLHTNEFLLSKLVHMYTSCGSIEDAEKLFDGFSAATTSSVYPWNYLLRGQVIHGGWRYRDVLSTYSKMRELGIDLNVYSFSCLIKSLAGASAFNQALKVHGLLIKNGFGDGSALIQTSLIDLYFKCGKTKLARQVFEEMRESDVVVWGAMIAGLSHNRMYREALGYLRWMTREGMEVNSVIVTTVLPVIGELGGRNIGREVHGYVMKTKNYANHVFIQSGLIDMYCKCGDMNYGRRVFYSSIERNAVSWTALISGYVANGKLDQALRSVAWMQQEGVKPDVVTVATVLPVCAQLKSLKHGKEIHAYTVKNGYLPNVSIITSLIVMYSKCGSLEYCCKLFDGMERRNVIAWTAMIDSYLTNNRLYKSLVVFRSMLLSKHRPDSVTISRMLSTCGELGVLKLGKEIHGHVLKRNFESIPFVSAEIVKMYGKCKEIGKAKLVFGANPCKGSMTWTAIIEAHGCNSRYQEALDLFKQVRSNRFTPNHHTFSVILSICDEAGLVNEACEIFNSMTKRYNVKASEEHYSSIIGLLTRFGYTKNAQRFIQMRSSLY